MPIDMKQIGERMKTRRDELELTQKEVADKLCIDRTTYAQYEIARNEVSALMLNAIAEVLHCPVSYFYNEGADDQDMKERELMGYYRGMPPDLKPAARAAMQALFKEADRRDDAGTIGKKAE